MRKPPPSKRHVPERHIGSSPADEGRRYVAGLDIGSQTTFICIKDLSQVTVWEGLAPSTVAGIDAALAPFLSELRTVGFETGLMIGYLHDGLTRRGYAVEVLNAVDVRHHLGRQVKTDRADARGIAAILAGNVRVRRVAVRDIEDRRLRSFLSTRRKLVAMRRALSNSIDSKRMHGGTDPMVDVDDDVEGNTYRALDSSLEALDKEVARLDKELVALARTDPRCNLLMTVPGIGAITAIAFVSALSRPERFRSSRAVGAYLGLTPAVIQSGIKKPIHGRITRHGDTMTRSYLYGAASAILMQPPEWSTLAAWGHAQAARRGSGHARVALARRLSVIMHRILVTGERYQEERASPRQHAHVQSSQWNAGPRQPEV